MYTCINMYTVTGICLDRFSIGNHRVNRSRLIPVTVYAQDCKVVKILRLKQGFKWERCLGYYIISQGKHFSPTNSLYFPQENYWKSEKITTQVFSNRIPPRLFARGCLPGKLLVKKSENHSQEKKTRGFLIGK